MANLETLVSEKLHNTEHGPEGKRLSENEAKELFRVMYDSTKKVVREGVKEEWRGLSLQLRKEFQWAIGANQDGSIGPDVINKLSRSAGGGDVLPVPPVKKKAQSEREKEKPGFFARWFG